MSLFCIQCFFFHIQSEKSCTCVWFLLWDVKLVPNWIPSNIKNPGQYSEQIKEEYLRFWTHLATLVLPLHTDCHYMSDPHMSDVSPSHSSDAATEVKIERWLDTLCALFCFTWIQSVQMQKCTAFNPKMRLFSLLPETLTFWIPCVTVFRDAKLSSDSADEWAFYARRGSAAENFSLELIADI